MIKSDRQTIGGNSRHNSFQNGQATPNCRKNSRIHQKIQFLYANGLLEALANFPTRYSGKRRSEAERPAKSIFGIFILLVLYKLTDPVFSAASSLRQRQQCKTKAHGNPFSEEKRRLQQTSPSHKQCACSTMPDSARTSALFLLYLLSISVAKNAKNWGQGCWMPMPISKVFQNRSSEKSLLSISAYAPVAGFRNIHKQLGRPPQRKSPKPRRLSRESPGTCLRRKRRLQQTASADRPHPQASKSP